VFDVALEELDMLRYGLRRMASCDRQQHIEPAAGAEVEHDVA
jgi:hypothetical protein